MPPPAGGGLRHRAHEARGIKTRTPHSGMSATVPASRRKVFVTNAWRAVTVKKFGQERWCYRSARRGDTALGIWACRPPAPMSRRVAPPSRVAPTVLRLNIGPEDLAAFLRAQCCTVVASFPCYSACGPAARQGRLRTLRGLRALLGAPHGVVLVREHHGGDGTAARWSRSPFSSARPPFAASPSVACVSRRRAHCGCGATGHRPRAAAHLGDNLTIETW